VVARNHRSGRDAIEAIDVEWTQLAAVVGVANAVKKGAPQGLARSCRNVLLTFARRQEGDEAASRQLMPSPKYRSSIRASSPISWKRARWFAEYDASAII